MILKKDRYILSFAFLLICLGFNSSGKAGVILNEPGFQDSIRDNFLSSVPPNMQRRNILNALGPIPAGTFGYDDTRSPDQNPANQVRRWGMAYSGLDAEYQVASAVGYHRSYENAYPVKQEIRENYTSAGWVDRIKFVPGVGQEMPQSLKLTYQYNPFMEKVPGYEPGGLEGRVTLRLGGNSYKSALNQDGSFGATPTDNGLVSMDVGLDANGVSANFWVSIETWLGQGFYTINGATAVIGGTLSLVDIAYQDGTRLGEGSQVYFESGYDGFATMPAPIPEPTTLIVWGIAGLFAARRYRKSC